MALTACTFLPTPQPAPPPNEATKQVYGLNFNSGFIKHLELNCKYLNCNCEFDLISLCPLMSWVLLCFDRIILAASEGWYNPSIMLFLADMPRSAPRYIVHQQAA